MAILTLTSILFITIVFISVVLFSKRKQKKQPEQQKNKHIHLCSTCMTGAKSLNLDEHSTTCPYIMSRKKGECPHYKKVL